MNSEDRLDLMRRTFVQEKQFEQWNRTFFYLNEQLQEKYDFLHQELYYIKLHEILTSGIEYAQEVKRIMEKSAIVSKKLWWYECYINQFQELKNLLSEEELDFIEYKRHNAAHIFQNGYENKIDKSYQVKKGFRNGKSVNELSKKFMELLVKHGDDQGFDIYITAKLNSKLKEIYTSLQSKAGGGGS